MKDLFKTKAQNRPELLAPAGSFETCRAVIHAGADAVYLGGTRFGARAYADNLTEKELVSAIDYAHLYGRKIYLTVNTLLKQKELSYLYDYLLPYYRQGLDAVIVQDAGVMQLIHDCFPDLPLHISTQMSICSRFGASRFKQSGAVRIVPARELSLEEIRTIKKLSGMEVECFVHGALCYCYSGQCLFSSMLGGRSGNRGRCAQPCRLPYTVLDDKKNRISEPGCYPLSPKDLCTIDQIPQLAKAGIDSFKIEGRMKSAEYAAGVTAIYRACIDRYLSGYPAAESAVSKQDLDHLTETGSRSGFTGGYYHKHSGPDMLTLKQASHKKTNASYLQTVRRQYIENTPRLPVSARAFIKTGKPAQLTVTCKNTEVSITYGQTQAAKSQPVSREMLTAQLSKTGNTPFFIEDFTVCMDDSVFLPKQTLNELRRRALDTLSEQLLAKYKKTADRPPGVPAVCYESPGKMTVSASSTFKPDCPAPPARQQPCFTAAVEEEPQLFAVLGYRFLKRIYLDSGMYTHRSFAAQLKEHVNRIKTAGKQAYLILPAVFREKTAAFYGDCWKDIAQSGLDGFLIRNQDALGFLESVQTEKNNCILDQSLYTYSDAAKNCYAKDGWQYDTVPYELNKKELQKRNNQKSELVIYGRLPLMTSAQCIYKTFGKCSKTSKKGYLKDRYAKEFPVRTNCSECCNTIYNSQPLFLIHLAEELEHLQPASYRLHFTVETQDAVHQVLNLCRQSFFEHKTPDMANYTGAYTNGHYKRGVE